MLGARRRDGGFGGEEGRGREVEWRLAHALGGVDGAAVGGVLEEFHAEVDGHVVGGRDLVCGGALGEERPVLHPDHLLEHEEPHALHEPALHLPNVDRGVQAVAHVVQNVGAHDREVSGQHVDLDLRARHSVGEVVERLARACDKVVPDLGRLVEPVRAQIDPVEPGRHRELGKRGLGLDAAELLEPLVDLLARVLDRKPVEVRADARRRRVRVGALVRRRLRDKHLVERHAKLRRRDLRHLRVQPLAHFGAAVRDEHGAVGVDVDERRRLVHELGGERHAELHRRRRNAALLPPVGGVERLNTRSTRRVVRALQQRVPHLLHVTINQGLPVRRHGRARRVEVDAAHVVGREVEEARDVVHVRLARHDALRAAEAAEGGVAREVGAAHAPGDAHVGDGVAVFDVEHGALEHGPREVERAPAVREQRRVYGHDLAGGSEAHLVLAEEGMPLPRDRHVLVAVERDAHRLVQLLRRHRKRHRDEHVARLLAPEPAAHPLHLGDDAVLGDAQHARDEV
mmetsp:Transcript_9523/g.19035  ORF Transcript_9523/g.19035 Transcript_9523/m.19035 type:complete len:514 (-) Transcript_9523:2411-3952(-)